MDDLVHVTVYYSRKHHKNRINQTTMDLNLGPVMMNANLHKTFINALHCGILDAVFLVAT